jgi:microcystin-dependent protein
MTFLTGVCTPKEETNMAEPFLGEIRIFAGDFVPEGWALCNGQLLPIAQNPALYSLISTTYGGDPRTNFALPNLQGSAPLMAGQGSGLTNRTISERGGSTTVTLTQSQMPAHVHQVSASSNTGTVISPANSVWGVASVTRGQKLYSQNAGTAPLMRKDAFGSNGENQPHNNVPPYLVLNFIIALKGLFPTRS